VSKLRSNARWNGCNVIGASPRAWARRECAFVCLELCPLDPVCELAAPREKHPLDPKGSQGPGGQPPRALSISGVLAYLARYYVVAYPSSRLHRPLPPDQSAPPLPSGALWRRKIK
jgi:hypothetical protein